MSESGEGGSGPAEYGAPDQMWVKEIVRLDDTLWTGTPTASHAKTKADEGVVGGLGLWWE